MKDPPPLKFGQVLAYGVRALGLVWGTSRGLTFALAFLTLLAGVVPAATAVVARRIVDAVVHAGQTHAVGDRNLALQWVALEAVLVVVQAAAQRGLTVSVQLLREMLGQRIMMLILEKAVTLDLSHFENSEFYDRVRKSMNEADGRPLSLVQSTFQLIQSGISLVTYGVLLWQLSPWAVLILVLAGAPSFIVETRFSRSAFRLSTWRTPETRQQYYLAQLVTSDRHAKEIMLYRLGGLLVGRYQEIFERLFGADRDLTLRRGLYGWLVGLIATAAFYGAYLWIVLLTVWERITLGQMTMYLLVFRQGQSAVSGSLSCIAGMYEDNLYISTLYEFLDTPVSAAAGTASVGPHSGDGVRFENVTFRYPQATRPAVDNVTLHLPPGQKLALVGENGSGKTTLIKLLAGFYRPDAGRILLDGLDVMEWDRDALRARMAVVFQDYSRFQFIVGENIGVGEVQHVADEARWEEAAVKGLAHPFIQGLPHAYRTQLGTWFKGGQELSGGQWQKVALSRALMRKDAALLVLDEPTSAMDAEAEAQVFEHIRTLSPGQMAILISHRFSTVRMADHIAVLEHGRIVEEGSHDALMRHDGIYARLFTLQAAAYR